MSAAKVCDLICKVKLDFIFLKLFPFHFPNLLCKANASSPALEDLCRLLTCDPPLTPASPSLLAPWLAVSHVAAELCALGGHR